MSVLDSEQMDAFAQALAENDAVPGQEAPEPASQPSPVPETDVVDHGVADANVQTESSTTDAGHAVPYGRFKRINEQRKELQLEVQRLQSQFEALQQQQTQPQYHQPPPQAQPQREEDDTDAWLRDVLGGADVDEATADPRYDQLQSRLEQFEVRQAEVELEKEINMISREYPGVPDTVLLNAVIADPEVDLRNVASAYENYVGEIEERAIAQYVERNRGSGVAPRPKASGGATSGTQLRATGQKNNNTLKGARDALAEAIARGNIKLGN
jgi:hypothetical protein